MSVITFSHTSETSHCPTICSHQNCGTLVAYYAGFECTDNQHVEIQYSEGTQIFATHKLPLKTGNPVLIPVKKNEAILIYSYFNDSIEIDNPRPTQPKDVIGTGAIGVPLSPVERWGYCTNWRMRVRFDEKERKIECSEPMLFNIKPIIGALMRCNPIKIGRQFLLPYYHEFGHYGLVAKSNNGWDWMEIGKIGFHPERSPKEQAYFGALLQPTLWRDKKTLYALCRDVTTAHKAWFSSSVDGANWSDPKVTIIDNYNNSIVAINGYGRKPWIIWNKGFGRFSLCLGRWDMDKNVITNETQLNPAGSKAAYPNYCWAGDQLHIVYTQSSRIVHHILDRDAAWLM